MENTKNTLLYSRNALNVERLLADIIFSYDMKSAIANRQKQSITFNEINKWLREIAKGTCNAFYLEKNICDKYLVDKYTWATSFFYHLSKSNYAKKYPNDIMSLVLDMISDEIYHYDERYLDISSRYLLIKTSNTDGYGVAYKRYDFYVGDNALTTYLPNKNILIGKILTDVVGENSTLYQSTKHSVTENAKTYARIKSNLYDYIIDNNIDETHIKCELIISNIK